jgi:hypothetical protein
MSNWGYTLLILVNIPLYYGFYRLLFRDLQDFIDAIFYWFKPDLWSWLDGEFFEDFWAELKLGAFIFLCAGCVYLEIGALKPILAS